MGKQTGENEKESLRLDYQTELLKLQNCTGMKGTAKEEKKSR
jgi:hypothetical protein